MELTKLPQIRIAQALLKVLGQSGWEAFTYALGYADIIDGSPPEDAARKMYQNGPMSLKSAREFTKSCETSGFLNALTPRTRTGSAENPITKMFPATLTEQRFLELLDDLSQHRTTIGYIDERETGHSLTDFTVTEMDDALPINIKNAGTRFYHAKQLVGLEPEDCVPIPAYKAHAAVDSSPNLIYVVSIDYDLLPTLQELLPKLFDENESIVWTLLNSYSGAKLRGAEDQFIFNTTRKYWERFKSVIAGNPFHVISARKAIRILHTKPDRTPGIGLRAWGTGASAEVNVHVSVKEDMTPWENVAERIDEHGIINIIRAVNKKRVEEVYDPEI